MAHIQAIAKRPPTIEEIIAWRDELIRTLEPFRKLKLHLRMISMPNYRIYRNGSMERLDDGMTPKMKAMDAELDATIQEIAAILEHRFREKFYDT